MCALEILKFLSSTIRGSRGKRTERCCELKVAISECRRLRGIFRVLRRLRRNFGLLRVNSSVFLDETPYEQRRERVCETAPRIESLWKKKWHGFLSHAARTFIRDELEIGAFLGESKQPDHRAYVETVGSR